MKERLAYALAWLEKNGSKAGRDGMARFALPPDKAYGVPMNRIQALAKELGKDHELAEALWQADRYEARMLAAYVDEPSKVTLAQMDRWCRQFDNWGVADTVCFALFDRTPHAWSRVRKWATLRDEFPKRGAFALLWGLTVHDKASGDGPFLEALPLVERAAADERHFVKKAVNMALRAIGKRNAALNRAAVAVAKRLAAAEDAAPRWVGRDALRELGSPAVARRLGSPAVAKRLGSPAVAKRLGSPAVAKRLKAK
jgi:3-methyladenine DNA glycosylase AlkD